jgi:hypothetical protein
MAEVFFSYSHKDEDLRDRLEAHLSMLRREGTIETWHDRRISAGDEWKGQIDEGLERADVILLLVSADFLSSYYCFDVEVKRAMQRHEAGEARVIPIILKFCDWHSAPFGKLQAAPKDGKPVVSWTDLDEAFLNVVQMLRNAISSTNKPTRRVSAAASNAASGRRSGVMSSEGALSSTKKDILLNVEQGPRSSNLRLKKTFTEADLDGFLEECFDFMSRFFQNSLAELQERNAGIESAFKRVDGNRFTAVVYQNGKARARCKVSLGSMVEKGISFSGNDRLEDNSMNESLSARSDDQGLYLEAMGMPHLSGFTQKKLTLEGAAEYYWQLLIRNLQ